MQDMDDEVQLSSPSAAAAPATSGRSSIPKQRPRAALEPEPEPEPEVYKVEKILAVRKETGPRANYRRYVREGVLFF